MKKNKVKKKKNKRKYRNYTLYVLLLEGDNYYIGMTSYSDINVRVDQHKSGEGARWTKLHSPIRIIDTKPLGFVTETWCCWQETDWTFEYIDKYGIEKVRGGAIVSPDLWRAQKIYNGLRYK